MLQALATLIFAGIAILAAGGIGLMLTRNRSIIARALGIEVPITALPQTTLSRYRTLPARRAAIMTIREAPQRAAA